MDGQQFCLKWNNHQGNLVTVFDDLLSSESFVDVTLACEGSSIKAHKIVLSACSPFFEELFRNNPCKHPIVILKDMKYEDLKTIVQFMYKGEVNVSQDRLSTLLKTAENLKVKGLAEIGGENYSNQDSNAPVSTTQHSQPSQISTRTRTQSSMSRISGKHGSSNSSSQAQTVQRMDTASPEIIEEVPAKQPRKQQSTSDTNHIITSSNDAARFNVPTSTITTASSQQMVYKSFDNNSHSHQTSQQSDDFEVELNPTDYNNSNYSEPNETAANNASNENNSGWKHPANDNESYSLNEMTDTDVKPGSPQHLPIQLEQEIARIKSPVQEYESFELGNSGDSFSDQSLQGPGYPGSVPESSAAHQGDAPAELLHNPDAMQMSQPGPSTSFGSSGINIDPNTRIACSKCNKTFKHRTSVYTHYNHEHRDRGQVYKCHLCTCEFKWKMNLSTHLDSIHRVVKEFECSVCGKYFRRRANLQQHFKSSHTGICVYSNNRIGCPKCNKTFKHRTSLNVHYNHNHRDRVHQYKCHLCDRKFKWKESLSNHLDDIHRVVKEFECSMCGKYFHRKTNLQLHFMSCHPGVKFAYKHHSV